MAKPSSRGPAPGPTIIRQLARLAGTPLPPSSPSVPDRLSQWFDWNRAVALQAALDGRLTPVEDDIPPFDADQDADIARTRLELETAVAQVATALAGADLDACHRHHATLQRSLQIATGRLRGRLRDMLSQGTPAQARLAEVDALLEQVLAPRESQLLGGISKALKQRPTPPPVDDDGDGQDTVPGPAPPSFARELQALLHSELELRFHPIEGLLAALRTH